jgi:AcrR family transcriptional regulator
MDSKSPDLLKDEILRVARKHFSLHGVQGASLKSIAQEAGVAGSLINYHFKDKNGLLNACLEGFASHKQAIVTRILTEPKTKEELRVRLEVFVDQLIVSVLEDPDGFEILQSEVRAKNPEVMKIFESTMLRGFKAVVQFMEQAQANGLIRDDLDPMIMTSLLFSCSCDSSRKDVFAKAFFNVSFSETEWRQKYIQNVVSLFLNGVLK